MAKITHVHARWILDSRGNPTVEVDINTESGFGRAAAPSGASTGEHEAVELRDGGKPFHGKGVMKAVEHVNKRISKAIIGKDAKNQKKIDETMIKLDGTKNKSNIGANAMVATSMAVMKAEADSEGIPLFEYISQKYKRKPKLPTPMSNIINGGVHAGNNLSIQEFMIVPSKLKGMKEKVQSLSEIYQTLKELLKRRFGKQATNVGDEGGFAPPLNTTWEALEIILKSIEESGYGGDVFMAIDAAASQFYKDGFYFIDKKKLDREDMIEFYKTIIEDFPIVSIEDPFDENDWTGFSKLNRLVSKKVMIVGDDIFVTNPELIERGIKYKAANALLLKVNQIGTVSEAVESFKLAKTSKWNVVVSHRSGETEDAFISHFSTGMAAEFIKTGAPARGERTAKYNELLRIEEMVL